MTKEYRRIINMLKKHNLAHYGRMIENTRCRIVVELPNAESPSCVDEEYTEWCKQNCHGDYFVYNENLVFFELEEEAVAFKLRWM